ncbi:hypothetical protein [Kitasatospora sp. NPDC085879]|uniref:hypothetical protein n=1 Tax=Kitasatospora sp. NPDC085879 TaxID=3154769 RepID=UPI00342E0C11
MRRDYGLVEAIFGDPENWSCRALIIEVHRLAGNPGLSLHRADQNPRIEKYVRWSNVLRELGGRGLADRVVLVSRDSTYAEYVVDGMNAAAHVVADESWQRDEDFPGFGDLWSVSVAPRKKSR